MIATTPLMVRIRKDAETLTTAERDRFLSALARLNDRGAGLFRDFRATHTDDTSDEAHGNEGFMPWHRGYLLDLERELQNLDPSVTLPYWRFDRPAPKLFTQAFIGPRLIPAGFARLIADQPACALDDRRASPASPAGHCSTSQPAAPRTRAAP